MRTTPLSTLFPAAAAAVLGLARIAVDADAAAPDLFERRDTWPDTMLASRARYTAWQREQEAKEHRQPVALEIVRDDEVDRVRPRWVGLEDGELLGHLAP